MTYPLARTRRGDRLALPILDDGRAGAREIRHGLDGPAGLPVQTEGRRRRRCHVGDRDADRLLEAVRVANSPAARCELVGASPAGDAVPRKEARQGIAQALFAAPLGPSPALPSATLPPSRSSPPQARRPTAASTTNGIKVFGGIRCAIRFVGACSTATAGAKRAQNSENSRSEERQKRRNRGS